MIHFNMLLINKNNKFLSLKMVMKISMEIMYMRIVWIILLKSQLKIYNYNRRKINVEEYMLLQIYSI
jgi:hypothetical protein